MYGKQSDKDYGQELIEAFSHSLTCAEPVRQPLSQHVVAFHQSLSTSLSISPRFSLHSFSQTDSLSHLQTRIYSRIFIWFYLNSVWEWPPRNHNHVTLLILRFLILQNVFCVFFKSSRQLQNPIILILNQMFLYNWTPQPRLSMLNQYTEPENSYVILQKKISVLWQTNSVEIC